MKNEVVYIKDDYIKLVSLLKYAGIVPTGGQAKLIISENKAKVNGIVCTQKGKKIKNGDIVEVFETCYEVLKSDN